MVFTSVICQGEILALAEKNGWGSNRRTHLEQILNEVPTLDISTRTILGAYATAHVSGAALLSTDTDFRHLDSVWFKFIHVSQRNHLPEHPTRIEQ